MSKLAPQPARLELSMAGSAWLRVSDPEDGSMDQEGAVGHVLALAGAGVGHLAAPRAIAACSQAGRDALGDAPSPKHVDVVDVQMQALGHPAWPAWSKGMGTQGPAPSLTKMSADLLGTQEPRAVDTPVFRPGAALPGHGANLTQRLLGAIGAAWLLAATFLRPVQGQLARSYTSANGGTGSMAVQGGLMFATAATNYVQMWTTGNGSSAHNFTHSTVVAKVALSDNGEQLFSSSYTTFEVVQWSVSNKTLMRTYAGATAGIWDLEVKGGFLFSCGGENAVRQWAIANETNVWTAVYTMRIMTSLAVTEMLSDLFVGGADPNLHVRWAIQNRTLLQTFQIAGAGGMYGITIAGSYLFSGSQTGGTGGLLAMWSWGPSANVSLVWTATSGVSWIQSITDLKPLTFVYSIAVTSDMSSAYVGGSGPYGPYVLQWSISNCTRIAYYSALSGDSLAAYAMALDQGHLYAALSDNTIQQWYTVRAVTLRSWSAPKSMYHMITTQNLVAGGGAYGEFKVYWINGGSVAWNVNAASLGAIFATGVSEDGLGVMVAGNAHPYNIVHYAVVNMSVTKTFIGHTSTVEKVIMRGGHVFSCTGAGLARAWYYGNLTSWQIYKQMAQSGRSMTVNDEGTRIFTAGTNFLVRVVREWFVGNATILRTYPDTGLYQLSVSQEIMISTIRLLVHCWSILNGSLMWTAAVSGTDLRTTSIHRGLMGEFAIAGGNPNVFLLHLANGSQYAPAIVHPGAVEYALVAGGLLHTACDDGKIRQYVVERIMAYPERAYLGHTSPAWGLDVRQGSLFSGSYAGKLVIQYNATTGAIIRGFSNPGGAAYPIRVAEDASLLFMGSLDSPFTISSWGVDNGTMLANFTGSTAAVHALCTQANVFLFSGGVDGLVRQWDVGNQSSVRTYVYGATVSRSIVLSSDYTSMFTGGTARTATEWSTVNGSLLRNYTGHGGTVHQMALSSDNLHLFTACTDTIVRQWFTNNATVLRSFFSYQDLRAVAVDPFGDYVFCGGGAWNDVPMLQWSLRNGSQVAAYIGFAGYLEFLIISGQYVYGSFGGGVSARRWLALSVVTTSSTAPSATPTLMHTMMNEGTACFHLFSCQSYVGAASVGDGGLRLFSISNGSLARSIATGIDSYSSTASEDGLSFLVGGTTPFNVLQFSISNMSLAQTYAGGHSAIVWKLIIRGGTLFSGSSDGVVKRWHVNNQTVVQTYTQGAQMERGMTVNDEGTRVFTSGPSGSTFPIKEWYVGNASLAQTYVGHVAGQYVGISVFHIAVSQDVLLSVSADYYTKLWSTTNTSLLWAFAVGAESRGCALTRGPGGDFALSGGRGYIYQYHLANGTRLASYVGGGLGTIEAIHVAGGYVFGADSTDSTIKQWWVDRISSAASSVYTGHTANAWGMDVVGNSLFSGSLDGTVIQYDVASGQALRTISPGYRVYGVVASDDGTYLFTGSGDSPFFINQFYIANGTRVGTFYGSTSPILALVTLGSSFFFSATSTEGKVRQWAVRNRTVVREHASGATLDRGLAITNDQTTVLMVMSTNVIRQWAFGNSTVLRTFSGALNSACHISLSQDDSLLASGTTDFNAVVWAVGNATLLRTFDLGATVLAVALSPMGDYVFAGGNGISMLQWAIGNLSQVAAYTGHVGAVEAIQLSGAFLFSTGADLKVRRWPAWGNVLPSTTASPVPTPTPVRTFSGHTADVRDLAFQEPFMFSSATDQSVRHWSLVNGSLLWIGSYGACTDSVAVSGDAVYAGGCANTIHAWSISNRTNISTWSGHTNNIRGIMPQSNGLVYTCSLDATCKEWAVENGSATWSVATGGAISRAAMDGSTFLFAAGGCSGCPIYMEASILRQWSVVNRTLLNSLVGHLDVVQYVSTSSPYLFSASADTTCVVWRISNATIIWRWAVGSVAMAVEGTADYIFAGGAGNSIYQWSLGNKSLIAMYPFSATVLVIKVHWQYLYTGTYETTIKQWDAPGLQPSPLPAASAQFIGHTGYVSGVAVEGSYVYTGSVDTTYRQWHVANGTLAATGNYGASVQAILPTATSLFVSGESPFTIQQVALGNFSVGRVYIGLTSAALGLTVTGSFLFAGGWDSLVRAWSMTNTSQLWTFSYFHVNSVAADGDYAYAIGDAVDPKQLFVANGSLVRTYTGHTAWSREIELVGHHFFTASGDGTCKQFYIYNTTAVATFALGTEVYAVAVTLDGFLFAGGPGRIIKQWDITTQTLLNTYYGHLDALISMDTADGYLYSVSIDGAIKQWLISEPPASTFTGHTAAVTALAVQGDDVFSVAADLTIRRWGSMNGSLLWTGSFGSASPAAAVAVAGNALYVCGDNPPNYDIQQWAISNLTQVGALSGVGLFKSALVVHGDFLYSGGAQPSVYQWFMGNGSVVKTFIGPDRIPCLSVDADSVFAGTWTDDVRRWSLFNTTLLVTYMGHTDVVNSVDVLGSSLFSGGADGFVVQWDRGNGSLLWSLDWRDDVSAVLAAEAEACSFLLVAGLGTFEVRQYALVNLSQVASYTGHANVAAALAVQWESLYTASIDGSLRRWSAVGISTTKTTTTTTTSTSTTTSTTTTSTSTTTTSTSSTTTSTSVTTSTTTSSTTTSTTSSTTSTTTTTLTFTTTTSTTSTTSRSTTTSTSTTTTTTTIIVARPTLAITISGVTGAPLIQDSITITTTAGAASSATTSPQPVGLAYRVLASPATLEVTFTYRGGSYVRTASVPSDLPRMVVGYIFSTAQGITSPPANVSVPLTVSLAGGSAGSVQFSVDPTLGPVYLSRAYSVPSNATVSVDAESSGTAGATLGNSYLYQITLGSVTQVVEQSYNPAVVDLADTQVAFAIVKDEATQSYYLDYTVGGNGSAVASAGSSPTTGGSEAVSAITDRLPIDATRASNPLAVKVTSFDPLTQIATTLVNADMDMTLATLTTTISAPGAILNGTLRIGDLGTFEASTNGTVIVPDLSSKGVQVVVREQAKPQATFAYAISTPEGMDLIQGNIVLASNTTFQGLQDVEMRYAIAAWNASNPDQLVVELAYAGRAVTRTAPLTTALPRLAFGYNFANAGRSVSKPGNVSVPLADSTTVANVGSVQFYVDGRTGPAYISRAYSAVAPALGSGATVEGSAASDVALGNSYLYSITLGGVTHVMEQNYNPDIVSMSETKVEFAILYDKATDSYYLGYTVGAGSNDMMSGIAGSGSGSASTSDAPVNSGLAVASRIPIDATQASSPVSVAVSSYSPVTKSKRTLVNALMEITPAVLVAAAEYATPVGGSGSGSTNGNTAASLGTFQLSSSGAVTVPDLSAKGVKVVVKEIATVQASASTTTPATPAQLWALSSEAIYGIAAASALLVFGGALSSFYILRSDRQAHRAEVHAVEEGEVILAQ